MFFSIKYKYFYQFTYVLSFCLLFAFEFLNGSNIQGYKDALITNIIPLIFCFVIVFVVPIKNYRNTFVYLLFFSITIFSLLGITKTLTGFPVYNVNFFTFGIPFYTVFLAYRLFQEDLKIKDIFIASNPLLLITGPIVVKYFKLSNTNFKRRFKVFFPFVIIGVFFYKIISMPLSQFLPMVEQFEILSVSCFAFIFELFIYFNFAGLSLFFYGLFGIIGIQIPLNFKQPFSSRSLVGYWKGWHLSLSYVLKSLFYIPARKINLSAAVFLVFISSALWHGVTFNFILWGVFQALAYIFTIFLLKRNFKVFTPPVMIFSVLFGRFLFLESDQLRFFQKINGFISPSLHLPQVDYMGKSLSLSLFFGVLIISLEFFFYKNKYFKNRTYKFLRIPLIQTILIIITLFLIASNLGLNYAVYGQR